MDVLPVKPCYGDYYDHGFNNNNCQFGRYGVNNSYKDRSNVQARREYSNRDPCAMKNVTLSPDVGDILKENLSDEKLDFDLEEHVLPPCFDSLLNAENEILPSPDMSVLKLASPTIESVTATQENVKRDSFPHEAEKLLKTKNDSISSVARKTNGTNDVIKNKTSPPISDREMQLIKEMNRTLDSIFPIKKEETCRVNDEFDFDNDIFEPLRQVPCLQDGHNLHTRISDDYHHEAIYYKPESNAIENNLFLENEGNSSPPFYDLIEEQVRNDKIQRENEVIENRKLFDSYLSSEQQHLIKRYIEGDKGHMPIPPINLELQEVIKRERKKHKNRVAASKCRKKKLEREAQLEVRVNYLKQRNFELNTVAHDLRNQATNLKQRILEHVNSGCSLNPAVLHPVMNQYYM